MPEGHKTHFIAHEHTALLGGQSLKVTSPQGRFRGDARKVSGQELVRVEAVGKHLFYVFDDERMIHVHLGRYGKFRQHDCPPPKPVGQVRVRLCGDTAAIDLSGPTACHVIDGNQRTEIEARLGPDPLAGGRKQDAWAMVSPSRRAIGAILLDQKVIAGVGNIFRAEALFETGINPTTRGCDLKRSEFDQLWRSIVRMLKVGLKHGRIITVSSREAGKPLTSLVGNERFRIYGNDDCPDCSTPIQTMELAARRLYYCPACQA